MNVIDWKKAPTWAQYYAIDSTGAGYFYEVEPALSKSLGMFSACSARVEGVVVEGWEKSLCTRHAKPMPLPRIKLVGEFAARYSLQVLLDTGWTYEALVQHGHAEWI